MAGNNVYVARAPDPNGWDGGLFKVVFNTEDGFKSQDRAEDFNSLESIVGTPYGSRLVGYDKAQLYILEPKTLNACLYLEHSSEIKGLSIGHNFAFFIDAENHWNYVSLNVNQESEVYSGTHLCQPHGLFETLIAADDKTVYGFD